MPFEKFIFSRAHSARSFPKQPFARLNRKAGMKIMLGTACHLQAGDSYEMAYDRDTDNILLTPCPVGFRVSKNGRKGGNQIACTAFIRYFNVPDGAWEVVKQPDGTLLLVRLTENKPPSEA